MTRLVLFVCVENACRSLMAEAIFNRAPPNGWVAASAGTRPRDHPEPKTGRFLAEIGVDLPPHPPQLLTPEMSAQADVVVTMGCLDDASCPAHLSRRPVRDWGLPDPARLDDRGFRAVREELTRRVDELRRELSERSPREPPVDPTR